jgi:hypothetical protein
LSHTNNILHFIRDEQWANASQYEKQRKYHNKYSDHFVSLMTRSIGDDSLLQLTLWDDFGSDLVMIASKRGY